MLPTQKEFNWSVPAPPQVAKRATGQKQPSSKAPSRKAQPRGYSPRAPTSAEFSRSFKTISEIPVHDKYHCLELCDQKYAKQNLLQFATHDESRLDAFVPWP